MGRRASARTPQNQIHSLFGFAGRAHDETLVAFENRQPVLDIGCIVSEAVGGFKTAVIDQSRRADFRNQLFLAVILCAEEGGAGQPVQAGGMTRLWVSSWKTVL